MEIEVASPSSVSLSETETEMARGKDTVRVKRKTLQAVLEQCQRALELISEDEGVFDDEDESKAKAKDVEQDGNQLNRVNPFASPVDRETDQRSQFEGMGKLEDEPQWDFSCDLEVDFESDENASIIYATLAVDKELQPDKVKRMMSVTSKKLSVHFDAVEARFLRASFSSFVDNLTLATKTIEQFGTGTQL